MTEAQKAEAVEMRKFFYVVYWALEPDCPANTGLRLVPQLYIKNAESVNPTYYRDLKAAGFEIDGVKLPAMVQIQVASICGDLDYFANLDWKNVDGGGLFAAANAAKKMLVAADDVDKAAEVLRAHDFAVMTTDVVCLSCANVPGSLAVILEYLAQEQIFIEYMYAFAQNDRANVVIKPNDLPRCLEVLQAHGCNVLREEEL